MPIMEYRCTDGHTTETFFKSISEAAKIEECSCRVCQKPAKKVPSVPLQAHLYGNPDGYHKPSPTKRHSTKIVSAKEGNDGAIG